MDWIAEHLQVVVAVALVIYWIFKARSRAADSDEAGAEGRGATTADDQAEAERTRQIQEEIRRRILARQRGETPSATPPPMPAESARPPVVVLDEPGEAEEPEYFGEGPVPRPPPLPRTDSTAAAAILEQQRRLDEQLQALRAARALGSAGVPSLPTAGTSAPAFSWSGGGGSRVRKRDLRRDLTQRTSLRRAIVLKEILGEPLGLQRGMPQVPRR